ncbi:hypothetical protein BJ165DRAFT_1465434 [Panaeolus papilionaceus]|nr:hypothetical protein BJ165DRAFT_1465434 [Panaeolus papilionaceus]
MPATRTVTQPISRSSPFPTPSPPSRDRRRTLNNSEGTQPADGSISSDDAESSKAALEQPRVSHSKPKSKTRPHKIPSNTVPLPQVQEIIEISSDDDYTPPLPSSQSSIIANLRRELSRSREEAARTKRMYDATAKELKMLREDNKRLTALSENDGSKVILNSDVVTEHFECAICSSEMWTPYILPGCGHTFCQKCLIDWFGTTQAKFLAAHPNYHANHNTNYGLSQILDYLAAYPNLATDPRSISALKQSLPAEPKYECPECRSPVTSPPIEAFAMKKLIRIVAASKGQGSPKPKSRHPVARNNPWDGFFPPSKLS